jgi:hypothetical protein
LPEGLEVEPPLDFEAAISDVNEVANDDDP